MSSESTSSPNGSIATGIVQMIAALAIYLWAREHSPNMSFGEMLMKLDSFYIKQPWYALILLFCAFLALAGFVAIVRGLGAHRD
jgi:hypothetical protein